MLKRFFGQIKIYAVIMLFYLFRVFPIKKNKIVISNFAGRGYGNEGKQLVENLQALNKNLDIVWLCTKKDEKFPKGIRAVKSVSIKSIYEQATARVWIDNRRKDLDVRKRKKQYYVQVWHGSGPCLKYIEADAADMMTKHYVLSAKNDSKMANLMTSGCEWRTELIKRSYWYSGEIFRCDFDKDFSNDEQVQKIRQTVYKYFNFDPNGKIILYAPTFRNNFNLECYDIDYEKVLQELSDKFGGKWYFIIRLHPNISHLNDKIKYSSQIINGSLYSDVEDLISCSEYFITDFSGCMFDAYKLGVKVILYASDFESYVSSERNLYFDLKQLPAEFTDSTDKLIGVMKDFNLDAYEQKRKELLDLIGYYKQGPIDLAKRINDEILKS